MSLGMDCEEPGGILQQLQPCPKSSKMDSSNMKKHLVGNRPSPLKISKESHKIRKASVPLPQVQYRRPVIIHTYSPKVIQTDPQNFMWLVQSLTGSSDTRSRCMKNKPRSPVPQQQPQQSTSMDSWTTASLASGDIAKMERPTMESSSTSSNRHDQESLFHDSSSESEGLVFADAVAMACESASVDMSPRGPLPGGFDSLFSIPPAPSFDCSFQGYQGYQGSFPLVEPFGYNPSSDFLQLPNAQPLLSSLNSSSLVSPSLVNEVPFSPTAPWNMDGLISPYKGSHSIQSLFSPYVFRQTPTFDSRSLDLLSPASDSNLYRDLSQILMRDV